MPLLSLSDLKAGSGPGGHGKLRKELNLLTFRKIASVVGRRREGRRKFGPLFRNWKNLPMQNFREERGRNDPVLRQEKWRGEFLLSPSAGPLGIVVIEAEKAGRALPPPVKVFLNSEERRKFCPPPQ